MSIPETIRKVEVGLDEELSFPVFVSPREPGPIRAELLGTERLESLARGLARSCRLSRARRASSPLLARFEENGRVLVRAQRRILDEGALGRPIGLDAEWLTDNFRIIDEVLREVRLDLPRGYDAELPKLAESSLRGYPRVYAIALALVAHTDSEVDEGRLTRFVAAFQEVVPLTIGELWALPTMLRLVQLENLRRLAEQMLWGWDEHRRAEAWAQEHVGVENPAPGPGDTAAARPAVPPLPHATTDPFLVRLLQLLRDRGTRAVSVLTRLDAELDARGDEVNEVLRREHRRQASNQVSIGNCVISLRLLVAIDWNAFFERSSQVEAILREDPAGVYARQDFPSRDRNRRAVERIARGSRSDELDVARRAVELARGGQGPARGHVGYYLVDRGQQRLKAEFDFRPSWRERVLDWVARHPGVVYFGAILAILVGLIGALVWIGLGGSLSPWRALVLVVVALVLPVSELAVGIVNHLATLFVPPRSLPKLDFKDGIADDCATIVVMPSMLTRADSAAGLLERLEIHYLANPDPQLRFALLTDFADAAEETLPEDEGLIRDALERVQALNQRYQGDGPTRFFLFHRHRIWNSSQNCWMGWERKRGKLTEFNRLIRGDANTSYAVMSDDPASLRDVRFVITLDADTRMPRDAARRLVGALAHPLNQPRFDPARGCVVEGYGVLQPRVSFHLTAATHSQFAALLAASGGIDPYSTAASDAYMDLFGVGSFTGKGIYEVDAFEAATGATFPENHILSHDLIEGNYARCGLLSDTELFDDFPARYHAYARREHRWVRGDWQILPWIGRTVPTASGPRPNPLPTLERWKVFDNLRRSLVPPALVVLLALGWTVLPGPAWLWTLVALAVPFLPLMQLLLGAGIGCVRSGTLERAKRLRDSAPPTAGQALLTVAFLADQARNLVDAIVRTLVRLFLTHRSLLEWETAASAEHRLGTGLASFVRSMWPASATAITLAVAVAVIHPGAWPVAAPILLAWLLSPLIAYLVSRPRPAEVSPLTESDRRELRRIARKSWLFFETFVGDENHWLPPDNYQEIPDGRVAHRTSPTNQGLLLLSTLAAHDLGYLGLGTLADRLGRSLDTFDRLPRHWGHFFNWYDTRTLEPLPPAYISTVDSGNLLGCLVGLRRGLEEKAEAPFIGPEVRLGLLDTLALVEETAKEAGRTPADLRTRTPGDLLDWDDWLARFEQAASDLVEHLGALNAEVPPEPGSAASWSLRLAAQVRERRAELAALTPWLGLLRAWEEGRTSPAWPSPELARRWDTVRARLVKPVGLNALVGQMEAIRAELTALEHAGGTGLRAVAEAVGRSIAPDLLDRIRVLGEHAESHAAEMDFRPLYKEERELFAIGCNLALGCLDNACYDLLASEAALTSFLTVARGDAPRRHWFHLGRPFIRSAGRTGLLSWGGTMFEYLMPRLLLRSLPGTLLAEACRTAVARQMEYGRQKGIPWGVSESAFNAQHPEGDYRYQSFGVPGLGLKRGLDRDLVVAPYATLMATMIAPREALENLRRLRQAGAEGVYGFHEAIDYTPDRLPAGQRSVVIRSYMAHHQGMSLVALVNAVLDDPMPRRFHSEPMVRAVDLLLQERIPRDAPIVAPAETWEVSDGSSVGRAAGPLLSRRLTTAATPAPRTHLLSNTQYHVMLTNAGSGFSRCGDLDVTRWREDATHEGWGLFIYVRDPEKNLVWSAGHQPVCRPADHYEVTFAADKATFRRRDGDIETVLEVTVSPEDRAEVRRVTLTNLGTTPRSLDVTSYGEIVLGPHRADLAHPAFGKLFLETEWLPGVGGLLCRRRPRSESEAPVWAVQVSAVDLAAAGGTTQEAIEYETDRAAFIGRGRTLAYPVAMDRGAHLSGTVGPVLDPILSLRRSVRLEPSGSATVSFMTAVARSREEALALADQFREATAVARVLELAWAHTQLEHRHRGWTTDETHLYQRLASHLIYPGSALRAAPAVLAANRQGQTDLWRFGISGDLPIALTRILTLDEVPLVHQLLTAHEFLRLKGFLFDLVLLSEEPSNYFNELPRQLHEAIRARGAADRSNKPGGVFVIQGAHLSNADKVLLQAAARVVLVGDRGLLDRQLERIERLLPLPELLVPTSPDMPGSEPAVDSNPDLLFFNGHGGFHHDGREYHVLVSGAAPRDVRRNGTLATVPVSDPVLPPAPWANIVANPSFGFLVSEAGSGTTWAGNSQANRLTPWSNDPVCDPPGEVVYLRDEETGAVWSPTPLPVPAHAPTLVRHGQGYTTFERTIQGLGHELTLLVPTEDPIKLIHLRVANPSARTRRLSATFYAEWVLGTIRDAEAMHVITELEPETGAVLARNTYRSDFASRVAFMDVDQRPRTLTTDRAEFLGRHGSVAEPAALKRIKLSGRVGTASDPCAALQVPFELEPGETREIVFLLGEAENVETVIELVRRYREPGQVARALDDVRKHWDAILGAVQVHTPDPGMNLLLNRWLLYQVLSCRIWGRTSSYQSGGAFGFRDQLQDVMALVQSAPDRTRRHILLAASRQYLEGDVQHWWYPPAGRGVRTRFSDDFLWLPFVACHYAETTGDMAIFDARADFLTSPPLRPGQEDDYGLPDVAETDGTLYEHCIRAIDRATRVGPHGLPLMGSGDWNDGMNRVGAGGQGESVWNAWFLIANLEAMAKVAEARAEGELAAEYRNRAEELRASVEEVAWDGNWYLRAFFDDGTPLGSSRNDECQIDSIAQTWAVISGIANPQRARRALDSVHDRLVHRDEGLILLFDPPFDAGVLQPGYVKGYLPGIRENGGQYTHAATWVVLADALLGRGRAAFDLFRMLNPIGKTDSAEAVARYRGEPYVLAGDVYARPPHVGRSGWTWYTGSASWLYRVGLEAILGFHRTGDRLTLDPCIPGEWSRFEIVYRLASTTYRITVDNPQGIERGTSQVTLDGKVLVDPFLTLIDDGTDHEVRIVMQAELGEIEKRRSP